MNYRENKYGAPISLLGYGCMRFSQKAGRIELEKTEQEIMEAYRAGVNYYDTAYIYPGSEAAIGEIFEKNKIRKEIQIATKLPHYLVKSLDGIEKYFQEELRRLRTDYVDYYLMHMLTDVKTWQRLKDLGIENWIREKKESGAIRNIGFSYHGGTEMFCALLDDYDWDFCQIQYNYLDEHSQAGRKGLMYANEKGIPVIIMEPLRGGRLVNNLPAAALKAIEKAPVKRSPAEWGLRWLWNQPQVTCVLSGMNSIEMVRENTRIASEVQAGEFTDVDEAMIDEIRRSINATMKVGCTGCRYCMPCPRGVDIPGVFAAYNRLGSDGKSRGRFDYMMTTALRKDPAGASLCVGCGKCEKHCPQHLEIRSTLKQAAKELEGPAYKLVRTAVRVFKVY